MLLSIFAFGLGSLIGRIRGGRWSGVTTARFHNIGFLIAGITCILVLNVIGPALPLLWGLVGSICLIAFGVRNLQITGMIVLLIGIAMNLAPLLANGTMPVSERALHSVGAVLDDGSAEITGLRESTATATRLGAFGDVIPVPVLNNVISLGDLVMLVALGDIAANLLLRARRRELDDLGVTFASTEAESTDDDVSPERQADHIPVLSPLSRTVIGRNLTGRGAGRPAHAAHRRPRRNVAPSAHVPAHALEPVLEPADQLAAAPTDAAAEATDSPVTKITGTIASDRAGDEVIDLRDPVARAVDKVVVTTDSRPIIDLTSSPSDEQLCEFLRRREEADQRLLNPPTPGPSRRRGRAPKQNVTSAAGVAEVRR